MGWNKGCWFLKKARTCRNCGAVFSKGSSCGAFFAHVRKCKPKKEAS